MGKQVQPIPRRVSSVQGGKNNKIQMKTIKTPIDLHIDFKNLTQAGIDYKVKHDPSAQLIWRIETEQNISQPKFERLLTRGRIITRNKKAKTHGFKYNSQQKQWELKLTQSWHRRLLADVNVQFKNFMEVDDAAVWIPLEMIITIKPEGTKATVICAKKLPLR